jgi:nucleoside-diphosphate-sugar epimerase
MGPVGRAVAQELVDSGADVLVVSRSGKPGPEGSRSAAIDVTDREVMVRAADGAAGLVNCLNPTGYSQWAQEWPAMFTSLLAAAEQTGAVLASVGNLYPYGAVGAPITATTPERPQGAKGRIRSRMWREALEAHREGRIRAVEVRAADYLTMEGFGSLTPALKGAAKGGAAMVLSSADQPHSWAHIPDVAATVVTALITEQAWGRLWMVPSAPARTARQTLADVAAAGGWPAPRVRVMPDWVIGIGGLFSADVREMKETRCERARPFVIDGSETTEKLGIRPTNWDQMCAEVAGQSAKPVTIVLQ